MRNKNTFYVIAFILAIALSILLSSCGKYSDETNMHNNDKDVTIYFMDSTDGVMCIDGAGCRDVHSFDTVFREKNSSINSWYGSKIHLTRHNSNVDLFEPVTLKRYNIVYPNHMVSWDN